MKPNPRLFISQNPGLYAHCGAHGKLVQRRGVPTGAWLSCLLLLLALPAAGCGYQMDTQRLPGNAHSLAIGQVENLTYTGELDVRLRAELRRNLMRNASFRLTSPENAELVLEVSLTSLKVTRPLDVSNTELSTLIYLLRGRVRVFRAKPRKKQVLGRKIVARVRLDFERAVAETPAVRDEIGEDVIVEFARLVELALYRHF